jgi:hypothetical protein
MKSSNQELRLSIFLSVTVKTLCTYSIYFMCLITVNKSVVDYGVGHPNSNADASRRDLCCLITPELVGMCVNKIALGKACGPDDLSVEHILCAHPSAITALCNLFSKIMVNEYVPLGFCACS